MDKNTNGTAYRGETMKLDSYETNLDSLLSSYGYSNIQKFSSSEDADNKAREEREIGE